ncbi:MAG: hypothetical protein ACLU38_08885 [Dysosmobacter sp.]
MPSMLGAEKRLHHLYQRRAAKPTPRPPSSDYSSGWKKKLLKTKNVQVVSHNADGTKSGVALSASWRFSGTYSGVSIGTITASTTVTLNSIDRSAPTVSCSVSSITANGFTISASVLGHIADTLAVQSKRRHFLDAVLHHGGYQRQRVTLSHAFAQHHLLGAGTGEKARQPGVWRTRFHDHPPRPWAARCFELRQFLRRTPLPSAFPCG